MGMTLPNILMHSMVEAGDRFCQFLVSVFNILFRSPLVKLLLSEFEVPLAISPVAPHHFALRRFAPRPFALRRFVVNSILFMVKTF